MNSVEFILKQLKELHSKFKNSNIRYEFSSSTGTHFIEITPEDFYNSDEYMDYELRFEDSFNELFPFEDLVFISENSLNKIQYPSFELYAEKTGLFRTSFYEELNAEFIEPSFYSDNIECYASKDEFALAA